MVHSRRIARLAVAIALTAGLGLPTALAAQLAVNRSNAPVLVMDPIPGTGVDSTYALTLADALRDRMASRYRFKLRIIPTETICEAKTASGFECSHIFPAGNAPVLARFLQAQGLIVSWVEQGPDSLRMRLRLINSAGSGLGGWMTVTAAAGATAEVFGRLAADQLEPQIDAAEKARECDQRRSQSDFRRARDRAREAFEMFPNHPAAAMCASLLFEVQGASVDSIIWALEKAVLGDSADGSAWEALGRRLVERGDTTAAVDAFFMQLRAEPGNLRLRTAITAQLISMQAYERADSLIAPSIEFNPNDLTLLQLREQACYDGRMWSCALEIMERTYELDSARQTSVEFKFKAFSGAQTWQQTAPDSALPYMLTWSQRIVEHDSTSIDAWRARSQALQNADSSMAAVGAFRRILALDPTQVSAAYAAASILWDSTTLVVDSTQVLDTARVALGDSLWTRVTQLQTDTATLANVAVQYYALGVRLVNQRMRLPMAAGMQRRALALDLGNRLTAPANFFLGLASFFQIFPADARLRAEQSCALVGPFENLVRETSRTLQIGRPVAEQAVANLMGTVSQVESQLPAYRANFCR